MKDVWAKEMKTQAPSFKEFTIRHEKIWKKELEKGDFSGRIYRELGLTLRYIRSVVPVARLLSTARQRGVHLASNAKDLAEQKQKKKKETSFS
jgi:hypothetical protein